MRKVTDKPSPRSKVLDEYIDKVKHGEVEHLHPDDKPMFITEEMEAEAIAKGEAWANSIPPAVELLINQQKKADKE